MKTTAGEFARLGALCALAALGIATVQPRLARDAEQIRERHDVYFLPPPGELATFSLGYRAALADVLWAHVLVSQGLHTQERRRFENLARLYDAIIELDPTWRTPYLLADALFTFQSNVTPYEDVLKVRAILELGVRHRPFDPEIWLNLGQFVAFLAPSSFLGETHPELAKTWRVEGAQMLARAAELGAAGQTNVSWQAIGAASVFERAGEREAAIRLLERTRKLTDDEELQRYLDARLARLLGEREAEQRLRIDAALRSWVLADLPFIDRRIAVVIGPPLDPDRCAGTDHGDDPACATSWREWSDRLERTPP